MMKKLEQRGVWHFFFFFDFKQFLPPKKKPKNQHDRNILRHIQFADHLQNLTSLFDSFVVFGFARAKLRSRMRLLFVSAPVTNLTDHELIAYFIIIYMLLKQVTLFSWVRSSFLINCCSVK